MPLITVSPPRQQAPVRLSQFTIRFNKFLKITPLIFVYSLLAFTLITYYSVLLYSTSNFKFLHFLLFTTLFVGCSSSFFIASQKSGGYIPQQLVREYNPFVDGFEEEIDSEPSVEEEEEDDVPLMKVFERAQGKRLHSTGRKKKMLARDSSTLSYGEGISVVDMLNELEEPVVNHQKKMDGTERFCRKCRILKPDRAHHCSNCGRCVLKMDHHCPWLGGACIGWANYKAFLLFLLYSTFLGFFVAIEVYFELGRFVQEHAGGFELVPISYAVLMLLGGVFGLVIGGFTIYHFFFLACYNRTTIEAVERTSTYGIYDSNYSEPSTATERIRLTRFEVKRLRRKAGRINIYDLGVKKNLEAIFGSRKLWWLLPICNSLGNGTSFPIDYDKLEQLESIQAELRSGFSQAKD